MSVLLYCYIHIHAHVYIFSSVQQGYSLYIIGFSRLTVQGICMRMCENRCIKLSFVMIQDRMQSVIKQTELTVSSAENSHVTVSDLTSRRIILNKLLT